MNTDKLPKTLLEAVNFFSDEDRAHEFFVSMRWPDGLSCVHCGSKNVGSMVRSETKKGTVRRLWNCRECKKQFTAKLGTIFAESPLPLSKWLPAVWLITNAKNGISSCEMARALGITQKSAWHMGHRIREAIRRGGGIVRSTDGVFEVDESYIGGQARFMHEKVKKARGMVWGGEIPGKRLAGKTGVFGVLKRSTEKECSKVSAEIMEQDSEGKLASRVRKYVIKGAEIHSDAHRAYTSLKEDYDHKVVDHATAYVQDGVHTNGLENFWSLLKRGLKGTYVHCESFHLFRYLDEQTFRFNERKDQDGDRGRFLNVVKTTSGRRLTWKRLTGNSDKEIN